VTFVPHKELFIHFSKNMTPRSRSVIALSIFILACTAVSAQEPTDALRYSYLNPSGSARNQAIGGAGIGLGEISLTPF
jgi:hypothetical protein